jgi:hypothetical protein
MGLGLGRYLVAALLTAALLPASAAAAADFRGKQIAVIVGSEPGGGTDASARLIAPYFEKYLPGNPTLVVRNMPGAQGVTALNFVVQQTKPDGLTLIVGANVQLSPLTYRRANGAYDPKTLRYVGGLGRGGTMLLIRADREARLKDRGGAPLFFGLSDGTRSSELVGFWGMEYLGWNMKPVSGYRGTGDVMIALERGEIDLATTANMFQLKTLIDTGRFAVLTQSGTLLGGSFAPRPEFETVPVVADLLQGKIGDSVARQAFAYWQSIGALDKWVGLAEGTDAEIVAAYRACFDKIAADADFLERGRKISEDLAPMDHGDVELLVADLAGTTEAAERFLKELQRKHGLHVE